MLLKRYLKNCQRLLKRRIYGVPIRPWQHQYRAIFIHIPKCAGTSLLEAFGHTAPRDHGRWIDYRRADAKLFSTYYKFAFVRAPWTRLHSVYQYLRKNGNGSKRDRQLASHLGVKECDFNTFVLHRVTPKIIRQEVMFWEQSCFIYDKRDRLMVDFLGRVETLDQDMEQILKHLPLPLVRPVPKANQTQQLSAPLPPEVMDRIARLYPRDTRLLGYR